MSERKSELPRPTEEETQRVIVEGLTWHGYTVLCTTRRPKRCHFCGHFPPSGQGDGVSKGLADLLVRHKRWATAMWIALEVKRPGPIVYSSPEQEQAHLLGQILVVQSLEEALVAVGKFFDLNPGVS